MAWYNAGTASFTNGSAEVTLAAASVTAAAVAGQGILGPDGRLYEIAAVVSDTQLTIAPAYQGATAGGQPYKIVPIQGFTKALADSAAQLVNDYAAVKNGVGQGLFSDGSLGAPGIRFSADTDTGIYRVGTNSLGFAVGGALAAYFNSQGRLSLGGAALNYLFNAAQANPPRGIIADFANYAGSTNGAQISFTQNGINNWCIGQTPGVDAFSLYRGRNAAAEGEEFIRVTSTGAVGIGTPSPNHKVHVQQSSGAPVLVTSETTAVTGSFNYGGFRSAAGGGYGAGLVTWGTGGIRQGQTWLGVDGTNPLVLGTNDAARVWITGGGNVSIGGTNPYARCEFVSTSNVPTVALGASEGAGSLGTELWGLIDSLPAAQVRGFIGTGNSGLGTAGDLIVAPRTNAGCSFRVFTGASGPVERLRVNHSGQVILSSGLTNAANDAGAASAGVPVNGLYRNGSVVMIRVS